MNPFDNPTFHCENPSNENSSREQILISKRSKWSFICLTLHSLGIIFGDIGTSPLYVLETIFHHQKSLPTESQCIGAVSLIIWSLILVVSIKYSIFILQADNKGEGGTFALCALLTKKSVRLNSKAKHLVNIVSILAASLLIGDGALTPAVSVLSAVEGLALNAPNLHRWVVPITIVILILLFICQKWGTSTIGNTFAPIMFIWFVSLFSIGIWRIRSKPIILKAFNPYEALIYLIREKKNGFSHIGGVFLSVTGCEALFADLGHFGLWPIRISWFSVVFPSVVVNYLGQGAHLIVHPQSIENPFYRSVPSWAHWPMLILATSATIIASQAIITGCFSLLSQAASLGFCGPLRVYHTNENIVGQIYVPTINWILLCLTLIVTIYFQSSSRLTNAYGLTVCSVSVITTMLYLLLLRYVWKKSLLIISIFSLFLLIDCLFWSSNALKFLDGAWIAILIALIFFFVGFSWYYGEMKLKENLSLQCPRILLNDLPMRFGLTDQRKSSIYFPSNLQMEMNSSDLTNNDDDDDEDDVNEFDPIENERYFIEQNPISILSNEFEYFHQESNEFNRLSVIPGLGCFLTSNSRQSPILFEIYLRLLRNIPQMILFLQIEYLTIPFVQREKRLILKSYGENLFHLKCRFGFGEKKEKSIYEDILLLAKDLYHLSIPTDEKQITYFIPNDFIQRKSLSNRSLSSLFIYPILSFYSFQKSLLPRKTINIQINPNQTLHFGILHQI